MARLAVLLLYPLAAQLGFQVVAAALAAGQPGGEHYAVECRSGSLQAGRERCRPARTCRLRRCQYLRAQAPGDFGPQYGGFYDAISKIKPDAGPDDIKWNFTKFLIGRDGEVIKRYEPPVPPADIKADLENYL